MHSSQNSTCQNMHSSQHQIYSQLGESQNSASVRTRNYSSPQQPRKVAASVFQRQAREEQERKIIEYYVRISTRAGVGKSVQDAFISAGSALSHDSNMVRVEAAAASSVRALILAERNRLIKLWDQLKVDDQVRASFWPFSEDTYTEDLLDLHEQEVQRWENELRECSEILALIDRREKAMRELEQLRTFCGDSTRLTDRKLNSSSVRRREERMHDLALRELPNIDAELEDEIERWTCYCARTALEHTRRLNHALSKCAVIHVPSQIDR